MLTVSFIDNSMCLKQVPPVVANDQILFLVGQFIQKFIQGYLY